jgi:hypothetical protein
VSNGITSVIYQAVDSRLAAYFTRYRDFKITIAKVERFSSRIHKWLVNSKVYSTESMQYNNWR